MEEATEGYGAKLRIIRSKRSHRRDEVLQVFELVVDESRKEGLLEYLKRAPDVSELSLIHTSQGRLYGLMRARGAIMRCIADSDCFLIRASNEAGREIEWRVLGTRRSLKGLMRRLTGRGIEYSVISIAEAKQRKGLTARQEWLLRSAYERGYFDSPKGIRLRALAEELGVSAPTLHESLRRTQKKLLREHFENSGQR